MVELMYAYKGGHAWRHLFHTEAQAEDWRKVFSRIPYIRFLKPLPIIR